MTTRQKRARALAIVIGLAATGAVIAAYVTGGLDRLEWITRDLRFKYVNPIRPSDELTCIAIDDSSIETVGRWPWSREQQAALVTVPMEFGARAILEDINWYEPQLHHGEGVDADILRPIDALTEEERLSRFPDYVLQRAIEAAGNVYAAYDYSMSAVADGDEFNALIESIEQRDAARTEGLVRMLEQRLRGSPEAGKVGELLARARLIAMLETFPRATVDDLSGLTNIDDTEFIHTWHQRCLSAALQRLLLRWLREDPARLEVHPSALFKDAAEFVGAHDADETTYRATVAAALRYAASLEATLRRPLWPLEQARGAARAVEGITPIYFLHARAARRSGFVNFVPDDDGVVRRVPLLMRHEGQLLAQIAFTLACDLLGASADRVRITPAGIELQPKSGPPLFVQLDDGRAVIPWANESDPKRRYVQVPADGLVHLVRDRLSRLSNEELICKQIDAILATPAFAELRGEQTLIKECLAAKSDAVMALKRSDIAGYQQRRADLDALGTRLAQLHLRILERAEQTRAKLDEGQLDPPALVWDAVERHLATVEYTLSVNQRLRASAAAAEARLRPLLQNKICLVGYAATALADMKAVPTHPSAAGVMAHVNLLSGLLTGQLVHSAPRWLDIAIAVAAGALMSVISVLLHPRLASLLVLFAVVAYVAVAGALVFYRLTYVLALTPVVGAMFFSFFWIAVYRYVFIDSERRQLATALSQYTSKEIARQVAENPELAQRAETREVTAMFTDLKGFTTISERIGAERTQKVLNACLGCFTDVMLRHEAMVNKFIGDGIFAFWNPVIYPQSDHALRACETALDLHVALDKLKREQRERHGDEAFDELLLRVGLATGNAVVGPCGSEQKYDYTCIGDSVNLAARLESGNKFYGTKILVAGTAREQVGERFLFRPLGGVQVKGKTYAVPIFELIARNGEAPPDWLEYTERFTDAIALFQRRQWKQAVEAFAACKKLRADDRAAEKYLEACARFLETEPGDDWNGALELTEK